MIPDEKLDTPAKWSDREVRVTTGPWETWAFNEQLLGGALCQVRSIHVTQSFHTGTAVLRGGGSQVYFVHRSKQQCPWTCCIRDVTLSFLLKNKKMEAQRGWVTCLTSLQQWFEATSAYLQKFWYHAISPGYLALQEVRIQTVQSQTEQCAFLWEPRQIPGLSRDRVLGTQEAERGTASTWKQGCGVWSWDQGKPSN